MYRIRKEIPHLEGIAVVIQQMIPAEISGITFTVHPLNRDSILIEASYGLGEMIVSGRIEPDDFTVGRNFLEVLQKKIGNKTKMAVCKDEKIEVVEVRKGDVRRQSLSDERLEEIGSLCLKVEMIFNCPQDIEWCIHNDKVWLIQSRPITVMVK